VVVQQGRSTSPPRPAPRPTQGATDPTLRNGYAAISHSVSSETAAIGLGFLAAGPVGAIVGGAALPVLVAASMWRARRREHDENTNTNSGTGGAGSGASGAGRGRSGAGGGRGNGGRHKTPGTGNGSGLGGGKNRKPKTKDPVLDKLAKGLDKLKPTKGSSLKGPKNNTNGGKADKNPKTPKAADITGGAKGLKDGLKDGLSGLLKDRGKQPASERPWRDRGDKPEKTKKDKKERKDKHAGDDTSSTTGRDGLDPKDPKGPKGSRPPELDQIYDGELIGDSSDSKPASAEGEIVDAEIVDDGLDPKQKKDPVEDRIKLVRARREAAARRAAIRAGQKAAADAARDGTQGDPHTVKVERIRTENQWIDLELHREAQLLALAASTEQRRNTPVTYPVATTQPAGTRTAGVAVARQIDARASTAYQLLVAMAEQLANGLHRDDDADMADHVIELVGIPAMCRNLSQAVREAAAALQKTAPLHPSVIKHLNNAAVAALTAARMADSIIVVFVQAHREDIYRVMEPRVGEERWNIRNAEGTLDGAKLRAAILSAGHRQLALPAGSSPSGQGGGGKLVPASHGSTKKLISLMKGFDRGHMVTVLSEVAGSAAGVEVVADSVTKLYRRMARSWPTEDVVDDTVRATASKVRSIADELRKAIKAAQRAHQRELKLNAKGRGKGVRAERKWDVVGRGRKG
jgi:hypothetical protein